MVKIGLVLSGGMSKGVYQLGVLKALDEFIPKENIKCISAASIGTVAGYSYIQGKLDRFEKVWFDTEQFNIRTFLRSSVKRSNLLDKVSEIVDENDKVDIDFYTPCLDMAKLHLDYINLKSVKSNTIKDYLKASISFVPVYKSVRIGNSNYVDGAVIDNIPVKPLEKYNLDYIIVVHFDKDHYIYENFDNKNIIEINFNETTPISKSLSFDERSSIEMMNKGYKEAHRIFSLIFSNGLENKDHIIKTIKCLNQNCKQKSYNMSGDIIIDRMNIFAKKCVYNNVK